VIKRALPDVEREFLVEKESGGPFLVDFYSKQHDVAVELNGPAHFTHTCEWA
jgi:very-short-patch-repair endonuclease